ncbi:alpha/beta fold hydrolase [Corynebacterium sp. 4HC-13]|uniref:Alpha/beta fold hydrolase n=2 Tax=Corynebacterium anserum TaxID=2684406 RepID=A0A7G7YQP5_9CORY|nr:alpha/beta fold hydrolase [Corynebacterium anserum]QNH96815.1 alpha/beta fold hydrolase [Corynebacterium anserum]
MAAFPATATAKDANDPGAEMSSLLSSVSKNQYPHGSSTGSSSTKPRTEKGDVDPFYNTDNVTPGAPGDILRKKEVAMSGPINGVHITMPKKATKVMYTTTDMYGKATPVTGYMVEPTVPWTGPGSRPTVVIGRGTVGQGDQCAPTRNWPLDGNPDPLTTGRTVNLEGLYDGIFAAQGVRVFVTDYIGMGTPGMHTYMNRLDQAHAMLDAARAARNLVGKDNFGKVGFYGHSQGGGASAAAIEEGSNYAPDLQIAGGYASAPPADLNAVQKHIDGSDLVGAIGFTINGLIARYPQLKPDLDKNLSPAGKAALEDLSTSCTDEITEKYGYQRTGEWTTSGKDLDALLKDLPAATTAMNDQKIGNGKPSAPVMIISGRNDANVEYEQAKNLAKTWCEKGGQVVYRDDFVPPAEDYNHFIQAISGGPFGLSFLMDRFNNRPVTGTCMGFNNDGPGDGKPDLEGATHSADSSYERSSLGSLVPSAIGDSFYEPGHKKVNKGKTKEEREAEKAKKND